VLYFFLSYAKGDEDDLVRQFFVDLSIEVRLLAGLPKEAEVGFIDASMKIGTPWSRQLVDALARCQCFIALMSPRYFLSQPCGQEWRIFADRSQRYEQLQGGTARALKPLIWIPVRANRLHPAAARIQYISEALGEVYPRRGIRQLMRLQRHQDAYREFVYELAEQIVEGAEQQAMPVSYEHADLDSVPSMFHAPEPGQRVPINGADPMVRSAALTVHFVVAAPNRPEAGIVRSDTGYYAAHAWDWAPYRPAAPEPLSEYAINVAAGKRIQSRITATDELAELFGLARQHNQIVVMLVDVWVTELDGQVQRLTAYQTRWEADQGPPTAVLIPGSQDDQETRQHWRALSNACRQIFRQLANDDELYRSNIPTIESFGYELPATLEVAMNRMYGTGRIHRQPLGEISRDRPQLETP
jgi:FxsC-like protein